MSDTDHPDNESILPSLTWDHLYAIDIQDNHSFADQLEVDRFEEVVANALESPDISHDEPMLWPGYDWDYNEEHAYPRRPHITTMSVKPASTDASCQTINQPTYLSIDLNALNVLFGDAMMELILPHSVIHSENKSNTQTNCVTTIDSLKGTFESILKDLVDICKQKCQTQSHKIVQSKGSACTSVVVCLRESNEFNKSNLTSHVIVYECPNTGCAHKSYQVGSLLNHIKVCQQRKKEYHNVAWSHQCSDCDLQFSDLSSVKRHLSSVHRCTRDASTQFPHFPPSQQNSPSKQLLTSNAITMGRYSPTQIIDLDATCPKTQMNANYPVVNKTAFAALDLKRKLNVDRKVAIIVPDSIPRFICPTCGASYNRFDSLTNHQRSQHPQTTAVRDENENTPSSTPLTTKYVCKYCAKQFNRKSRLIDHELGTHENLRRFSCPQCPHGESRGYKSRLYLRMHQRKCHENSAPTFRCPICFKYLSSKLYLGKHLANQHANPLKTS